jgi:hypothetical protein
MKELRMHADITNRAVRLVVLIGLCATHVPSWAAKVPQIEANRMRWEMREAVLNHAIAWQEDRGGRWVTVVLLTDRAIKREALAPDMSADSAMEAAKAQGFAFAVMSGGVPLKDDAIRVWFRDGAEVRSTNVTGEGGFDIVSQSATQIKGRALLGAFGIKPPTTANAWSVSFDAPVLRGDAARMQKEGEPLGATGGQPATDLLAAMQAKRNMDYAALANYASPDMAAFLSDAAARPKNLKMLQSMTSPQARMLGGLRQGDKAFVYWQQIWPDALDNRCIDEMILKDGKWRSIDSACQPE